MDRVSGWSATRFLAQLAISPNGRSVAYQRFSPSGTRLFVSPLAGGKPVRLAVSDAGREDSPAWSPDGNWIAFLSKGALYKVRVGGGTAPVRLRDDANQDAHSYTRWSRTDRILYRSRRGLTLVNADGSDPRVLSSEHLLAYDWTPDGSRIFAIRENDRRQLQLVTLDLPDGRIRHVTALGVSAVSPEPIGYSETVRALVISPDGRRAAFAYLYPESDIWMLERVTR